jgi:UDP-glucose 4-epimerase
VRLLIPGGAGYIGSHMVRHALRAGHEVTILDDFSTGHRWATADCEVLEVNLLDQKRLNQLLAGRRFDGVIHFAAKSLVGESMTKPDIYFRNNVVGTMNLVDAMLLNDCQNLVFSSTAAIFGNPLAAKISEEHPKKPINPYGRSKFIVEQMLESVCNAYNFNACCLRYFNAAGADPSGGIGESHDPETHLIPNVLGSLLKGGSKLKVFGDDYDTSDGTCIRDYVHVNDLAQAHLLGLKFLEKERGFNAFNLGNGSGYSVLDIVNVCSDVAEREVAYEVAPRREGDPATLVADSRQAINKLGWKPEFGSLTDIISSAWLWHKRENTP